MQLHAITSGRAIFTSDNGKIYAEYITQGARDVLEWHARNVPVNDR